MHNDPAKGKNFEEVRFEEAVKFSATKEVDGQSGLRSVKVTYGLRTILVSFGNLVPTFVLGADRVDTKTKESRQVEYMLRVPDVHVTRRPVPMLEDLDSDDERVGSATGQDGEAADMETLRGSGKARG